MAEEGGMDQTQETPKVQKAERGILTYMEQMYADCEESQTGL